MSTSRSRGAFVSIVLLALSGFSIRGSAEGQGVCDPSLPGCIDPRAFQVRAYGGQIVKNGGKCLDYTPEVVGSPVFLNDCSRAHPIGVSQLAERIGADGCARKFEVLLRAGTKVIGVRTPLPGQAGVAEPVLELQDRLSEGPRRIPRVLDNQTFVYDGDSIILASDRDPGPERNRTVPVPRVVKVQNSRGANGSAIVLGPRQLSDSEFWELHAVDGSGREPTCNDFPGDTSCAFVHVNGLQGLVNHLATGSTRSCWQSDPKWPDYDTVIVVDSGPIILSAGEDSSGADSIESAEPMSTAIAEPLLITDGVTVRGDRRGARLGPELALEYRQIMNLFQTSGNDIRISGLRLRGGNHFQSTCGCEADFQSNGVVINETQKSNGVVLEEDFKAQHSRIVVDHNDIYDFTWRGVFVGAGDPEAPEFCYERPPASETRPNVVQVSRNFLHDNLVQNKGYGVNANSGAFPLIEGNTFWNNRHAIAGTNSSPYTGYRAWSNIVLDDIPVQVLPGGIPFLTHDFDLHGTGYNGFCGIAGGYTEVAGNTFLGTGFEIDPIFGIGLSRTNFEVRGVLCGDGVDFRNNISLQSEEDTIELVEFFYDPPFSTCVQDIDKVRIAQQPYQFNSTNPTNRLGVGDFDGDGRTDLFLATRTAFYYSPGGEAEWRLLASGRTDPIRTLLFGDFDGDGRTDVIGKNGANINVSWGGAGEWERLNAVPAPITDLAVGNFDGVGSDDIFWATGRNWYLSAGGSAPFEIVNTSSFRVQDLRFGDFNGNGKTDVFGVVSGNWMFSDGATTAWTPLRTPRLTDTVTDLFIGDFNGDSRDDIGHFSDGFFSNTYEYWATPAILPGTGGFVEIVSTRADRAAAGRFLGGAQWQLLFWDDREIDIVYVGSGGFAEYSRQDMK